MSDYIPYYLPLTTELYVPRGAQPLAITEALSWPFSCGGFPGVSLSKARTRGGLDDLDMRAEPIFLDGRSKITYRHKPDGPDHPLYSKQMNAMYTRNGAHLPIPRFKVVQQVAQFVSWFIKKEAERRINSAQFPRFGPGFLTLDQLYLLELKQISAASYQIILGIVIPQPALASAPYVSNTFAPEGFELGFETFSLGDVYPW